MAVVSAKGRHRFPDRRATAPSPAASGSTTPIRVAASTPPVTSIRIRSRRTPGWTRYFALQSEIKRYIADCVERFDLRSRMRFNTAVQSVRLCRCRQDDGRSRSTDRRATRSLIAALSSARSGSSMSRSIRRSRALRASRARSSTPRAGRAASIIRDKRVALIGTGASQPSGRARRLRLMSRGLWSSSARRNGCAASLGYHDAVGEAHRWAFRNIPFYWQLVPPTPRLAVWRSCLAVVAHRSQSAPGRSHLAGQ